VFVCNFYGGSHWDIRTLQNVCEIGSETEFFTRHLKSRKVSEKFHRSLFFARPSYINDLAMNYYPKYLDLFLFFSVFVLNQLVVIMNL